MRRSSLRRRRPTRRSAGRLGVEALEVRLVLAGGTSPLEPSIERITWLGSEVDTLDGAWNGRFESATPYGTPALPPSLLPLPTWTTVSLGDGFFQLLAPDADPQTVLDWAAGTPGVLSIEPDFVILAPAGFESPANSPVTADVEPTVTPNDPDYPLQYAPPLVQAPSAWTVSTGSRYVVVAVLDSGIDLTHPDLAANVWINPREVAANGIDDEVDGF